MNRTRRHRISSRGGVVKLPQGIVDNQNACWHPRRKYSHSPIILSIDPQTHQIHSWILSYLTKLGETAKKMDRSTKSGCIFSSDVALVVDTNTSRYSHNHHSNQHQKAPQCLMNTTQYPKLLQISSLPFRSRRTLVFHSHTSPAKRPKAEIYHRANPTRSLEE